MAKAILPSSITALKEAPIELRLDHIREPEFLLRTEYDEEALDELGESIVSDGQLQTILVQPSDEDDFYDLIIGSRRTRAARRKGLKTIFGFVVSRRSPLELIFMALAENMHRKDFNPFEEAQGFLHIQKTFGLSLKEIAERTKKKESFIRGRLELLSMPEDVQGLVAKGQLPIHHVKTLARVPTGQDQVRLAHEAIRNHYSPTEMAQKVRQELDEPFVERKAKYELTSLKIKARVDGVTAWLKRLPRKLKLTKLNAEDQRILIKALNDLETEASTVRLLIRGISSPVVPRRASPASNGARNFGQEWTAGELRKIHDPKRPSDEELAKTLGRTVSSIRAQRASSRRPQKV